MALHLKAIISQRLITGKDGKRVVAYEVMMNSAHIADLITQGRVTEVREAMEKQARENREGVVTFDQSILDLWRKDKISAGEAIRNADSKHNVHMTIEFEQPGALDGQIDVDLSLEE
jgi:twitching motility protein PilU